MTRVPAVSDADAARDERVAAVYDRFAQEGREPIALYRALANAPALLHAYNGLSVALRRHTATARGLRELAILRTAHLIGSEYEWAHHVPMARAAGVGEAQIAAVTDWAAAPDELFTARERAILAAADGVHACALSDAAYAELERCFGTTEAVELVTLLAFYQAVARLIDGLGVELEPGYRPPA